MENVKELVVDESVAVVEEAATEVAKPNLNKGLVFVGLTVLTLGGYALFKKVKARKAKQINEEQPTEGCCETENSAE